jgi:hypothetical protein
MANPNGGPGRNTKYRPEFDDMAYNRALLGVTDEGLAELFGVCLATISTWKKEHPSFLESITRGKEGADEKVAKSLYGRALGVVTKTRKYTETQEGPDGTPIEVEVTEHHLPPDTQAASLWLRNRQSKQWRDKQQLEHSGVDGKPIETNWTVSIVDATPRKEDG